MSTINPRLKAYVRIDASGRVIESTIVLRKQKPKIGRWIEVQSSLCCTTTTD